MAYTRGGGYVFLTRSGERETSIYEGMARNAENNFTDSHFFWLCAYRVDTPPPPRFCTPLTLKISL